MGTQVVTRLELLTTWRARADELRPYAPAAAEAFGRCADDLELAMREEGNETLNLKEAALASGYSADHLARLVKSGKIPNAGTENRPRIRRANLPKKATAVTPVTPVLVGSSGPRSKRRTG